MEALSVKKSSFLSNTTVKYYYLLPLLAKLPQPLAYRLVSFYAKLQLPGKAIECEQIYRQMQRVFVDCSNEQLKQWADYLLSMQERELLDAEFFQGLHSNAQVDAFVRFHNHQELLSARQQGRHVLLTTGHFGRFWMVGVGLDRYGISMGTITRDSMTENKQQLPEREFKYRAKKLQAFQQRMKGPFLVEGNSVRPIYRALDKHVMTILMDIPHDHSKKGGIEVPFLGKTAKFPLGIAKIARQTNALIFPYYVLESREGLDIHFSSAIEAADLSEAEIMQQLVGLLENIILAHPEQWWLWPVLPVIWQE